MELRKKIRMTTLMGLHSRGKKIGREGTNKIPNSFKKARD